MLEQRDCSEIAAGINVENEVLETEVPLTEQELKILMEVYRRRHPEQFFGTREWEIKVNSEYIGQVCAETGVLLKPIN